MSSGDVNAHTHLYSGLAPLGLPAPDPPPRNFSEILERVWWKLDRALDPATLRASARFYVAEALLAGTTGLVDHHESPRFIDGSLDVIADACEELGLPAVVCYGATERNGGREEARRGLRECRRFIEANTRPFVRGGVGLHASFTVSDETLREAGELARELKTVVHVHVAEDRADVDDARQRGFAGPLERLLELGALPPGSIVAHGVHLDVEQVRRCEAEGLWLVHNPRSNANNRVGWARSLGASARVALGTDGFASDLVAEEAALLAEARAHGEPSRAVVSRRAAGRHLFSAFFPDLSARVEPGRIAIGGREVVDSGRLAGADAEEIRAHAREAAPLLWKRMNEL